MDQNLKRKWIGPLCLEGAGYVLWDAIFVFCLAINDPENQYMRH